MPGTRVWPSASPSVNLVPGIHILEPITVKDVEGRSKPGYDLLDRFCHAGKAPHR